MTIKKAVVSIGIIFFFASCIYLFVLILASSLRFEEDKISDVGTGQFVGVDYNNGFRSKSWFASTFVHSPLVSASALRSELIKINSLRQEDFERIRGEYQGLLSKKPTWPYYFSGIAQLSGFDKEISVEEIQKAMRFGSHERKVVYSLAEVLFYRWDKISEVDRSALLGYLSNQADPIISKVVEISAKFARIYEYCDFLYEKKHVEYAACKRQYWQPLLGK